MNMAAQARTLTVIGVVLVVGIILLTYLVVVGVAQPLPELGPEEDPTPGDEPEPQPIAEGNYFLKVGVDNQLSNYYAEIEEFTANVYPYGSPTTFSTIWKLDLMGWLTEDDIIVEIYVRVTGPGGYETTWKDDTEIRLGEIGWAHPEFESGKTTFWDAGTYSAVVKVYLSGEEFDGLACQQTFSFSVS